MSTSGTCESCGVTGEFLEMSGTLFCEVCGKKQMGGGGAAQPHEDEANGSDEAGGEAEHQDGDAEAPTDQDGDVDAYTHPDDVSYDLPEETEGDAEVVEPAEAEFADGGEDGVDVNEEGNQIAENGEVGGGNNVVSVDGVDLHEEHFEQNGETVGDPPQEEPPNDPHPPPSSYSSHTSSSSSPTEEYPPVSSPRAATVAATSSPPKSLYAALAARRKKKGGDNAAAGEAQPNQPPDSPSRPSNLLTSLPSAAEVEEKRSVGKAAVPIESTEVPSSSPYAAKPGGGSRFKAYRAMADAKEAKEKERAEPEVTVKASSHVEKKDPQPTTPQQPSKSPQTLSNRNAPLNTPSAAAPIPTPSPSVSVPAGPMLSVTAQSTKPSASSAPSLAASSSSSSSSSPSSDSESLRRSVRKEVEASFSAELEILTMENKELTGELLKWKRQFNEMKKTADESIRLYEGALKEKGGKSVDYTANLSILESEIQTIRKQYEDVKLENANVKKENGSLRIQLEEKVSSLQSSSESMDKLRVESAEWRGKFEDLKATATNKLKSAASEYLTLKSSEAKIQQLYTELRRENTAYAEKWNNLQVKYKEVERDNESLRKEKDEVEEELKGVKMEIITLTSTLTSQNKELNEMKMKMEEAVGLSTVYKDQVLTEREKVRQLDSVAKRVNEMESDAMRLIGEIEGLQKENQSLKIQLFDKTHEIQELTNMLEGLMQQIEQKKR